MFNVAFSSVTASYKLGVPSCYESSGNPGSRRSRRSNIHQFIQLVLKLTLLSRDEAREKRVGLWIYAVYMALFQS